MNSLHGIKIANDIAAVRGKTLQYRRRTGELLLFGEPLTPVFRNRKAAVEWATRYNAIVAAV